MKRKIFLLSIIALTIFAGIHISDVEGVILNPNESKYIYASGELINLTKFSDEEYSYYKDSKNDNYQYIYDRIGTIKENEMTYTIEGNIGLKANLSVELKDNVTNKKIAFDNTPYSQYGSNFKNYNITVEIPKNVNITEVNIISKSSNGTILSTQPVLIVRLNEENTKLFKKCDGYSCSEEYCEVCVAGYCFNPYKCRCIIEDSYYDYEDSYSNQNKNNYYFIPFRYV